MSPCVLWEGSVGSKGYGRLTVNGRRVQAHRHAFELATGISTVGKCVCHRCDVPLCVNPEHLFLGTQSDNLRDMRSKGRHVDPPHKRGEAHYEQKLSDEAVRAIRARYTGARGELKKLAAEYGVTYGMIGHVVHRRKWRHV